MKKNKTISKIIFLIISVSVIFCGCFATSNLAEAQSFGKASGHLGNIASRVDLGKKDVPEMVGGILEAILVLLGVIAFIVAIVAGIRLMTAGGNEEAIASSKKMIVYAVIGLLVVIISYTIVFFVISKINGAVNRSEYDTDDDIQNLDDGPRGDMRGGGFNCGPGGVCKNFDTGQDCQIGYWTDCSEEESSYCCYGTD